MNWDKPLGYSAATLCTNLNDHHGLNLDTGGAWHKLVNSDGREFYPAYIRYCKIMCTPLGQALS